MLIASHSDANIKPQEKLLNITLQAMEILEGMQPQLTTGRARVFFVNTLIHQSQTPKPLSLNRVVFNRSMILIVGQKILTY
jgi:hypothetical protein